MKITLVALFACSLLSQSAFASKAGERELLCAITELNTEGPVKPLDAEKLKVTATEGASVGASSIKLDGVAYHRVQVEHLFESARITSELWFANGELVCAQSTTSTMNTILAKTKNNPDGIPPAFRRDRWILNSKGEVLVHHLQEAPEPDQRKLELSALLEMAPALLKAAK